MKKSLVLTGMMGVGKSTIGKLLSIRLKMRFVDIDRIIENQEKMLVKDIFEKKGEQYFRKLEEKKSMEILEKEDFVIALGGGAFVNDNIRTLTIKNCISFWLNASTETLLNRNSGSKKRPLLKNMNLKEILIKIADERKRIYKNANFRIDCDKLKPSEIIKDIIEKYKDA